MRVMSLSLRAGARLLEVMPPRATSQAWNLLQRSHLTLFRASGGRLGGTFGGVRVLMLHHIGRRSGEHRVSPLLYIEDGDLLAIIASKGGHPRHPAWFHNLMAHPDTQVELRQERREVRARVAQGDERAGLWSKATAVWPDYENYQLRTGRTIPVVVLERR
jgi:deazaflavin-dependent oxidoreductase (nitroreductase family)